MSFTVWTGDIANGKHYIVLTDIPNQRIAEKLIVSLRDIYGDDIAWIEED